MATRQLASAVTHHLGVARLTEHLAEVAQLGAKAFSGSSVEHAVVRGEQTSHAADSRARLMDRVRLVAADLRIEQLEFVDETGDHDRQRLRGGTSGLEFSRRGRLGEVRAAESRRELRAARGWNRSGREKSLLDGIHQRRPFVE